MKFKFPYVTVAMRENKGERGFFWELYLSREQNNRKEQATKMFEGRVLHILIQAFSQRQDWNVKKYSQSVLELSSELWMADSDTSAKYLTTFLSFCSLCCLALVSKISLRVMLNNAERASKSEPLLWFLLYDSYNVPHQDLNVLLILNR